ncbi:unnamed protein product [Prunus armeniaca]|uniref:Myb-like domain-containing protein n=1 Tax=Prunus armeniaca TaxID=36596 RepID=A0A6J5VIH3_PRUAR|nr:unnamed protein product [Prunus armeniaca]
MDDSPPNHSSFVLHEFRQEDLSSFLGPLCYPSRFSNNLSRPLQPEKPSDDQWTFDENKRFENALTELNLDAPYLFQKLSTRVPGKTVAQVKKHFEALFEDILMIESGHIAVPEYNKISTESKVTTKPFRRRRTPWTKHEHNNLPVVVLEGVRAIWEGRLEEHFQVLRSNKDPNSSCKSCPEVLPLR